MAEFDLSGEDNWPLEYEDTEASESFGPYYRDKQDGLWTHTSGQEDDVCACCGCDLSDVDDFYINTSYARWRLLCRKCAKQD